MLLKTSFDMLFSAATKRTWISKSNYVRTIVTNITSTSNTEPMIPLPSCDTERLATIPADGKHSATVIFLHGLGQNGNRWVQKFQSIRIPYIKYVLPTAPIIPVTWQNGNDKPAWFNVKNLYQYDEDERGITNAVRSIHTMIRDEIDSGVASNRIILVGFSQGGGLALHSGLTFDQPLAALVGLSCRLPLPKRILSERRLNILQQTPILHCHGDADKLTPIELALTVSGMIKSFNKNNYTFKTYSNMLHTTCQQEMNDVKDFIAKHLPPK